MITQRGVVQLPELVAARLVLKLGEGGCDRLEGSDASLIPAIAEPAAKLASIGTNIENAIHVAGIEKIEQIWLGAFQIVAETAQR